jgi:hypothetical protein
MEHQRFKLEMAIIAIEDQIRVLNQQWVNHQSKNARIKRLIYLEVLKMLKH